MSLSSRALALIFDMDGVIVHSNPEHCAAWADFNRQYGLETTPGMLTRMYGKRNDEIVRDYFGPHLSDAEIARRGREKETLYRRRMAGRVRQTLVPGLREFLDSCGRLPLAIATNAEPANVDFILEESGLRPYFSVVVDGHQVSRPKPHPDVYLKAASLLGVQARNCVVFEDSESGVAAALAAEMRVIGLCTTHGYLQGTSITVDNFKSEKLREWMKAQVAAV